MTYFLVGLGGALGAMARHAVNHFVHQRWLSARFPWGIFVINVVGSLAIGVIAGLLASQRLAWGAPARTFVIVGFLGGFTTFSSFSLDTLALARDGLVSQALLNVVGQVALSLIAVWIGYLMAVSRA